LERGVGYPLSWWGQAPTASPGMGRISGFSDGDSMGSRGNADAGMRGWEPVLARTGGWGVPLSGFGEGGSPIIQTIMLYFQAGNCVEFYKKVNFSN